MSEEIEDSLLRRLRRLDSCTVSDALDRLSLGGQATGLRRHSGSGRIAGRAVTLKVGPMTGGQVPRQHLGTAAIAAANQDSVIVVEQRSGIEAGCWGGLLSLGAKIKGVQGVVADGPVRDIDEAVELALPVFTNRLTSLTARGRVVEVETNGRVSIAQASVSPGDYVLADDSAVVFVSSDNIENVLSTAEQIAAREATMAKAILAGEPIGIVMGKKYETMLTQ